MSEPIRILVADDHLIIRQGLRLILETQEGFEMVGEAADGAEAVRLCAELRPDVVLMDLRMPGLDGLSAIERLRTEQPGIAVVILTTFNEDDLMMRGLQLGAKGYLLKDTDREALFNTIRAASRGETLLKPEIMARVLAQGKAAGVPATMSVDLTERELEVLRGVAQGGRSKEIAFRLGITERTVKAHLASIYNRLGVDSRAAAIAVAAQKGIL
jgi:NarL family two-component system response regulator YdfI